MSISKHHRNNLGFSLIEMMLVVGIMGIIAAAFSQILWESKKFQSHIELKTQTGDFKRLVSLSITSSKLCKEALFVDENPIKIEKGAQDDRGKIFHTCDDDVCTPSDKIENEKADFFTQSFNQIKIPGQVVYKKGETANDPRLKIKDLRLEFLLPMSKSGDDRLKYIANIGMVFEKTAADASYGGPTMFEKQPVIVKLAKEGNTYTVSDCYIFNEQEGKAACDALGGTWLSNTNNQTPNDGKITATMCPRTNLTPKSGKCVFTNVYPLSMDENPDGVDCRGGANALNERPEFCYYQPNGKTTVVQQACPSRDPKAAGKKCVFNTSKLEWQFVNQAKGGSQKLLARCNKGVDITRAPSSLRILTYKTTLEEEFQDNSPWYTIQTKYLGAVSRCMVDTELQTYRNCTNPDDLNAAMSGRPGSCIYVKNATLINPDNVVKKRIEACNKLNNNDLDTCPLNGNLTNYTGWIKVADDHPRKFVKDKPSGTKIVEARGVPCFEVEVMEGGVLGDELKPPYNPQVTEYLQGWKAETIAQCLVEDRAGKRSMFICQNETEECSRIGTNVPGEEIRCRNPRQVFSAKSCWIGDNSLRLTTNRGPFNWWFYFRAEPESDSRFTGSGQLTNGAEPTEGVVCSGGIRVQ